LLFRYFDPPNCSSVVYQTVGSKYLRQESAQR
jgi:hypothetical protein